MGNCASVKTVTRIVGLPAAERTHHSELVYPLSEVALIRIKDSSQKVHHTEKVVFAYPQPLVSSSREHAVGRHKYVISSEGYAACILPGFDPRGQITKSCQDMNLATSDSGIMLSVLFDGHGKEGQPVVNFCKNEVSRFFSANKMQASADPQRFLMDMVQSCDEKLRQGASGIDASYSGSTCVGLLINAGVLYCAGVGDSRAVLGTSKPPEIRYAEQPARGEDKLILQDVMRRRSVQIDHPLQAVQLTKDQKPEDPQELERITRMGGAVRRLMDENGRNIGPYRVWKKDTNYPGLAMSRSIGDMVGAEIGVISTPHLCMHKLQEEDAFIVIASDGVWDVMENSEVVDYVEAYRHACQKGNFSGSTKGERTCPGNAPIAQLLCEEARMRWLVIVEEEDVIVDDISCVVIEMRESIVHIVQPPDRCQVPNMDAKDAPNVVEVASIPASTVKVRDPRRGSISE